MESFPAEVAETPSVAEDPALGLSQRSKLEILGAVLLGMFLSALDQTIVGPVMPRIVSDLNGVDYYTWVATIYLLTSTVTVPIYGKLSDLYGRKPILMGGIGLFLIGSALSGASQEMWQLVLFRGIQGLGAGALFPIALAVIGDLFTPAERGKYQGLFGLVFGVSFLLGPGLGGYITDNASWHWIFYVNIPVGLVALAVIWRLLPNIRHTERAGKIDWLGVTTLVLALVPILIGFTIAQNNGFGDPYFWVWTGAGLAFLVAFILVERRAADPVIPLGLFRNRTFSASMVSIFFATFGFGALIIFLPFYFLIVEGVSYTESGYRFLPFMFGLITSSIISGQLVSRTGRYKPYIIGGILILIVGQLLMTNLRVGTSDVSLATWMFISGLGIGPTFAVFTIVVQNAVPFQQLGAATSDLTLFRQIGTTIGIAVAFVVFRLNLTWDLLRDQLIAAGAPAALVPTTQPAGFDIAQLTNVSAGAGSNPLGQIPAEFLPIFERGFHSALTIAIANSIWLGVGAAIIAVVSAFFLKEIPLRTTLGARTPAPAAQPMQATPAAD
ncbi:MAG TPA: MDR family MFS transporter [Candidatus Polarisedimenticolia bacterium]|nr:MDR family MFS transporter [Candidatus Polarisedimenticolia bacterium]